VDHFFGAGDLTTSSKAPELFSEAKKLNLSKFTSELFDDFC